MATKEPLLIICKETKIHKPKPRRINKKSNIVQYNNRGIYMNRQPKQRGQRIDNHELKKLNKLQNYINGKKHSFNLDLISFEEIEKDFKDFKSKSEEMKAQKELIQLIRKAENESCRNECYENYKKIKRPHNPFCKNIE